jgi:hypothetical protein
VQCGSAFLEPRIPVGHGQNLMLAVLAMILGLSRFLTATMLPSRQAGDLLAGMWDLINALGKVPKTLIWDGIGHRRQGGSGCSGGVVRRQAGDPIQLAPSRDPEFKCLVERNNGYFGTSFLPGRTFASAAQFNTRLAGWLTKADGCPVCSTGRRPDEALDADLTALPRFLRRQGCGPGSGRQGATTSPIRAHCRGENFLQRLPRRRREGDELMLAAEPSAAVTSPGRKLASTIAYLARVLKTPTIGT